MKVAVTGASGFLGVHVLASLRSAGIEVVATHFSEPPPELGDGSRVKWVHWDIFDPPAGMFEDLGRPDSLIHLAWSGLPNYRSLHHFESELPAQYRFLATLISEGLSSLVITGTCFEYGALSGPIATDSATAPNNPYGFAKDTLRRQLEFLKSTSPFNLAWARLFYLFGEGQAESSLYSQLRRAVADGKSVFQMSRGEQLRDFLPVDVVAGRLVELALEGADTGPLNICSGVPRSVRGLVEGWIAEHNWDIELDLGVYPYPDYEPMAFWGKLD
jgi:dTDP-6-deoxy-L-talose 4-dehydrogenase (NAD+)